MGVKLGLSHSGGTYVEIIQEQGAEKDIWACIRGVEKTT